MLVEFLLITVGAATFGGWIIPVGLVIGLPPIAVFAATYLGAMAMTSIIVLAGGQGRDRLLRLLGPDAERRVTNGRARRLFDRWGVIGLAAVGMIVLGPTVTVLAVLLLDVDRARFLRWAALSTLVFYVALTAMWWAIL